MPSLDWYEPDSVYTKEDVFKAMYGCDPVECAHCEKDFIKKYDALQSQLSKELYFCSEDCLFCFENGN